MSEAAEPAEVEVPPPPEEPAKPVGATEAEEGKPAKKTKRLSKWLAWQRTRLLEHQRKKKEEKKAARKEDLDFLEAEVQASQGFALVPSYTPSKEELRAEALALAREEVQEELRQAKKARDDLYQRQLASQTSLTRFFSLKPKEAAETGQASGAGPAEGGGRDGGLPGIRCGRGRQCPGSLPRQSRTCRRLPGPSQASAARLPAREDGPGAQGEHSGGQGGSGQEGSTGGSDDPQEA